MKGHVDTSTLAEHREGLLRRRQRAAVDSHLAQCSRCAALDEQLAGVPLALAAAPPPVLPPALISRLDAALAAEASRVRSAHAGQAHADLPGADPAPGASTAAGASPGGTLPGPADRIADGIGARRDGAPAWRRARTRLAPARLAPASRTRGWVLARVATAVAVVAVVGGAGYAVSQLGGTGSSTTASSASSPGRPSDGGVGGAPTGGGSGAPGFNGALYQPSYPVVASGADYQPRTVRAQVSALLARYASGRRIGTPAAGVAPHAPPSAAELTGCVSQVAGGRRPELVDVARYAGRPAAVVVVPAGTGHLVWIIGTRCSARGADVFAKLDLAGQG